MDGRIGLDAIQRQLRLLDERLAEKTSLSQYIFARCPLLILACSMTAGICLQSFLNLPIFGLFTIAGIIIFAFSLLLIFTNRQRLYVLAYGTAAAFALLGMIRLTSFYQLAANDISNFVGSEKTLATIEGFVATAPRVEDRSGWLFGKFWPIKEKSCSFYLKLDAVKTKTGFSKAVGTVRIQAPQSVSTLKAGDHVRVLCWLSRFGEPQNSGQFDIAKYMAQKKSIRRRLCQLAGGN